ncbi:MAG: class I SAM-dependent methyltransferase [Thermoleophilaceae bacterium]
MLAASVERIETTLPGDATVLDVGGWGRPLTRADWVLDVMPYETRGAYGRDGTPPERFSADTWVQRDMCEREPWPFADGRFDFAICSHTLEDLRDPVWVCSELVRVARAGYVEVPSRLEEQSFGVHGPWVGWSHHRWLIDVGANEIEFVHKPHVIHSRESDHFPAGFHATLSEEERVQTLWWEGGFEFRERVMTSAEELDPYLAEFVAAHRPRRRRLLRR